jgi:hypothetical protein
MQIVIFFVFVAVCALALLWASRKTRAESELAQRKREQRNRDRAEKLVAPRDSLLSHNDAVWQSRRHHANTGVERVNQFTPKSSSSGVPEYDGYSRRDRHHVRDRNALVRESAAPEQTITMTAIRFRTDDEEKKPVKTAS